MLSRFEITVLVVTLSAFLFSVGLWFTGYREEGIFVGIWVPSLVGIGNFLRGILARRGR